MGGGQPYLYSAPAHYNSADPFNGFNPKAASQASFVAAQRAAAPRREHEGPLLEFNRHPDSYAMERYGNLNAKPMHKNTRKRVARARKGQMGLRILQLLGGLAMMVFVICLKVTKANEAWIVRVPPAVDLLFSLYGIYNMARKSKNRTPATTASYHAFALVIDMGLIPFYVFTSMLAHSYLEQTPGIKDRWTSFFDSVETTNVMIQATFLAAAVMSGLHLFSAFLDLYLLFIFRKITSLPPDMNPLEDNLTSRRKTKHKYKGSETALLNEKRLTDMSGTTINSSPNRMSMASDKRNSQQRISFYQSREDRNHAYSPHNPKTARISRQNLAEQSTAQDRHYGNAHADVVMRESDSMLQDEQHTYANRMSPMPSPMPKMPKRHSAHSSLHSFQTAPQDKESREELRSDNWFVLGETPRGSPVAMHGAHTKPSQRLSKLQQFTNGFGGDDTTQYQAIGAEYDHIDEKENEDPLLGVDDDHPLRMNPPTPLSASKQRSSSTIIHSPENTTASYDRRPKSRGSRGAPTPPPHPIAARRATRSRSRPENGFSHHTRTTSRAEQQEATEAVRTKTMSTDSTVSTSPSKYSIGGTETVSDLNLRTSPQRKLYGDLASAMKGVRQHEVLSPRPKSVVGSLHWANSESGAGGSEVSARSGRNGQRPKSYADGGLRSKREDSDDEERPLAQLRNGGGRVVSRSGADVPDGGDLGLMGGRRREVSGKVAEEGRAGSGWFQGGLMRRISGQARS